MSGATVAFAISAALGFALVAYWRSEQSRHDLLLERLALRIHVNGIRGKSTVTRLIAGMLREAGYGALAKTTGTAAAVIPPDGVDRPVVRRGAPTVLEQIRLLRQYADNQIEAIVFECMAVRPLYQAICEDKIIRAHIGVITNVREDHQDEMGATLPEIARSLLNTCPRGGVLLTAEQDESLLRIMREEAGRRHSRLVVVHGEDVTDEEIQRFCHVEFKENVAVGLAIASLLGIDRKTAVRGMVAAPPEVGVMRIEDYQIGQKEVQWVNLFASNDRQSVVGVVAKLLDDSRAPDTTAVALLNNRHDRPDRAMMFGDFVTRDLAFDRIALMGAYETVACRRLIENDFPHGRIVRLGEEREFHIDEIVDRLIHQMPTRRVLLIGMVNIHTRQSEMLLQRMAEHEGIEAHRPGSG